MGRIFFRLTLGVVCLLVIALIAADILTSRIVDRTYKSTLHQELAEKGSVRAALPRTVILQKFQEMARASGTRLTIIDGEGKVVRDSEANSETMANHRSRPEFAAALAGGEGVSVRSSATLGVPFLYVAVPMEGGALRLAMPVSQIAGHVRAIRNQVLVSTAIGFLPAVFIALLFARYISSRLGAIIAYAGKLAEGRFDTPAQKGGPR